MSSQISEDDAHFTPGQVEIVRGSLADSQHELLTLQGQLEFSAHLQVCNDNYSEDNAQFSYCR